MKIAIPMVQGRLSPHFGHCECFVLFDVDEGKKEILNRTEVDAPPHEPGLLPGWLHQKGVEMIFAGGMGQRAQDLFTQSGVKVLVGSPSDEPEAVVRAWFNGTLSLGQNVCDH